MDENLINRKLERERSARRQAEALLEVKSRELYETNQALRQLNECLEQRIEERTLDLKGLNVQLNEALQEQARIGEALRHENVRYRLLHDTALAAAQLESYEDALQACLQGICQHSRFVIGHVYLLAEGDDRSLVPTGIWHVPSEDSFVELRRATMLNSFRTGIGLPGRVLETGSAAWIEDIRQDDNFPRNNHSENLQVISALGCPVIIRNHVIAVLEFFSEEQLERDETFLETIPAVVQQIGRVLERQRAAESYRQAKLAADSANDSKSQFLANMSHEIRSPLNIILGMTAEVLDTTLTEFQREYIEMVQQSGLLLLEIINDVLDLSRIEADKLELEAIEFDPIELVQNTLRSVGLLASQKGLALFMSRDSSIPRAVIGDPTRIRQIVSNLLVNAIKFTARGSVDVQMTAQEIDSDNVELRIAVRDSGIGIPEDKQQSIFDHFEQADSSTTRRYGGTGLGLAIISRLVEMMRGTLELESVEGEGSRFTITIPFERAKGADPVTELWHNSQLQGIRVLALGEPGPPLDNLLTQLRILGLNAAAAHSNQEAQAHLLPGDQSATSVQAMIVDNNLAEAELQTLLTGPAFQVDSPPALIFLSERERAIDAIRTLPGRFAQKTLRYPVFLEDLRDVLQTLIVSAEKRSAEAEIPREPASNHNRTLQILLVDDGIANQILAKGILEKLGHTVSTASTGRQACTSYEVNRFDLVLMDMHMPEMDGLQAATLIRQHEQIKGRERTPIVALTASAMTGDREKCIDVGMDDYISKPFSAKKLADVIGRVAQKID